MVFTVLINGYSTWYCCCLEAPQVIHSPCQASKPIVFLTISPICAVVSSGHHWCARSWSFPFSLWRHGNPSYPFFFPRRRCPYLNRVKTPQGSFCVFTSPPISRLCWLPSTGCHLLRWTSQLPEPGGSHYCFHQIDFAISVCIWESRRAGEIKAPT